jgi:hypothetical protein
MEYRIIVGQHRKFLFETNTKGIDSMDKFIRVFEVLTEQFPESEGFWVQPSIWVRQDVGVDSKELIEAIKAKKGKGLIMKLNNKKHRAWMLAYIIDDLLRKGIAI